MPFFFLFLFWRKKKKKKLSACRGEGSAVGLQLRVRFVPAALLAMPEIGQVM
jgi:hypothetical protein